MGQTSDDYEITLSSTLAITIATRHRNEIVETLNNYELLKKSTGEDAIGFFIISDTHKTSYIDKLIELAHQLKKAKDRG